MLKCHGCNAPVCEECREHAFKGFGYKVYEGRTLCEHCHADQALDEPERCRDCGGTKIRGICAENGEASDCAACPTDEYEADDESEDNEGDNS